MTQFSQVARLKLIRSSHKTGNNYVESRRETNWVET